MIHDINPEDKAVPCVEPAPEIGIVVRFNGQQQPAILTVDQPETIRFGTFEVEVTAVQIIRKKIRPAKAPPWNYLIVADDGTEHTIRAMDEACAARIFARQTDKTIFSIEPEIS